MWWRPPLTVDLVLFVLLSLVVTVVTVWGEVLTDNKQHRSVSAISQSVSVVHRYMCQVSACQSGTMPQLWAGGLLLIWSRAHSSQLTMTGRLYVVNLPFEYTDILLELLYYTVDWTATLWIVVVSSGYSSHFFSCLYTQRNLSLEVGSNYFSLSPHSQPQHDKSSSRFHNFCSSHLPQLTSELSLIMLEWWWLENKMNHAEDQTEMNNYKIHHLAGLDHGRAVRHHRQHLASLPQPSPSPAPAQPQPSSGPRLLGRKHFTYHCGTFIKITTFQDNYRGYLLSKKIEQVYLYCVNKR